MKEAIFLVVFCFVVTIFSQQVEMEITNLRNNKGCIRVGIFDSEKGFKDEKAIHEFVFSKAEVNNGKIFVRFTWKEGRYGFAILDDENEDGKMNYNFLGAPLEGYGFSNYIHSGISKPSFSDFVVNIKVGNNRVKVKMQYVF